MDYNKLKQYFYLNSHDFNRDAKFTIIERIKNMFDYIIMIIEAIKDKLIKHL